MFKLILQLFLKQLVKKTEKFWFSIGGQALWTLHVGWLQPCSSDLAQKQSDFMTTKHISLFMIQHWIVQVPLYVDIIVDTLPMKHSPWFLSSQRKKTQPRDTVEAEVYLAKQIKTKDSTLQREILEQVGPKGCSLGSALWMFKILLQIFMRWIEYSWDKVILFPLPDYVVLDLPFSMFLPMVLLERPQRKKDQNYNVNG